MSARDFLKLILCCVTIGPAIVLSLQWSGVIYQLTPLEQGAVGAGAEFLAVGAAVAWMLISDRRADRQDRQMFTVAAQQAQVDWMNDYIRARLPS